MVTPVSIKHGLRTTDCGLGIKHGLGIKRGLQTADREGTLGLFGWGRPVSSPSDRVR